MKKGIIMEVNDTFLTLVTPEGEFLKSKKQNQPYSIGEEIYFFPHESGNASKSFQLIRNGLKSKTIYGLAAALLVFIGTFIPIYQDNNAYAYMSIDVNPSIELGVNKKMQVVELTGYNKDGSKIISHLDGWKKKDVSELTQTIIQEMKKGGYLKNSEQVVISTVRTTNPEENVEKELQKNMDEIKKTVTNQELELTVLTATKQELEKAHELGITTGKYQETKNHLSEENGKQRTKNVEKKAKNEVPSQPSQTVPPVSSQTVPPGQMKKQMDNNETRKPEANENKALNNMNRWDGKSMPPGQLKKMEEPAKQNQGQSKKHIEKSNQNKAKQKGKNRNGNK